MKSWRDDLPWWQSWIADIRSDCNITPSLLSLTLPCICKISTSPSKRKISFSQGLVLSLKNTKRTRYTVNIMFYNPVDSLENLQIGQRYVFHR